MDMHWTRRAVMGAALTAMAVPAIAGAQQKAPPTPEKSAASVEKAPAGPAAPDKSAPVAAAASAKGKLTDQSLGTLLKAMGIEATSSEQRYDFNFKSTIEDAEWELSMSSVLSQDASSIWIMAWLDELPKSAADVPRTALLRLLSDNDKLGKGKFFAYIAGNRRFVLQRVIPNENISTVAFRAALDDLGQSVVSTHAHWSVANWTSSTSEDPAAAARSGAQVKGSAPQQLSSPPANARPATSQPNPPSGQQPAAQPGQPATTQTQATKPLQSAVNDPKFAPTVKK